MNAHYPVLSNEVIEELACAPGRTVVDCTVGAGGHAKKIREALGATGRLIGIDRDATQLRRAKEELQEFRSGVMLVHDSYEHLPEVLHHLHVPLVDGVLLDLGVAHQQLDDPDRGMGFHATGALDLRFNTQEDIPTAAEILRNSSLEHLEDLFRKFGELERPRAVARAIVRARASKPLRTIEELQAVVLPAIGRARTHHPLTLVLQALRIAVNDELGALERALPKIVESLEVNGRIVVLTYHSLEDRIIKQFFVRESQECLCPPKFPVCRCQHKKTLSILTKKPIVPTLEEARNHPSTRSAKLRVAQRIAFDPPV